MVANEIDVTEIVVPKFKLFATPSPPGSLAHPLSVGDVESVVSVTISTSELKIPTAESEPPNTPPLITPPM